MIMENDKLNSEVWVYKPFTIEDLNRIFEDWKRGANKPMIYTSYFPGKILKEFNSKKFADLEDNATYVVRYSNLSEIFE